MKGEQVFRAVGQVGDDLIARAEKIPARQAVRWKPLAALAACCALIVGIAALALPNWLGSNKAADTTAAASEAAPQAAMVEETAEARAYSEDVLVEAAAPETEVESPAAEAPAMDAPTADAPAAGASEQSARAQAEAGAPDGDWIVFGGQYYTLAAANDEAHTAGEGGDGEARGARLGTVDDSKDGTLTGCAVYAYPAEGCVLVERDGEYLLYRAVE